MKRLFILSAAVAALASCSNSEVITEVNEPQVPDKAIAFETFSSNATRAENSSAATTPGLEKHHENFQVWADKDVPASCAFNGTEVSFNSADNIWEYTPIRFWDKGANKYYFYACAPSTKDVTSPKFELKQQASNSQEGDYFFLSGVRLQDETMAEISLKQEYTVSNAKNTDYMIASPCVIADPKSTSTVQLSFNHILSRLNVGVKKATKSKADNPFKNATVTLNELKVCNMQSTGSFDESATISTGTLAGGTTDRWNTTSSPVFDYTYTTASTVNTTESFVLQSLVIPQTVSYENVTLDGKSNGNGLTTTNAPYICIKYNIKAATGDSTGENFVRYINLAKAFGKSAENEIVAFNEGWQNTLHITIDADVISFDAEVYYWADNGNSSITNEGNTVNP